MITQQKEKENDQRNSTVVHPPFLPLSTEPESAQDGKENLSDLQFVPLPITFLGVIIACPIDIHLLLQTYIF